MLWQGLEHARSVFGEKMTILPNSIAASSAESGRTTSSGDDGASPISTSTSSSFSIDTPARQTESLFDNFIVKC